MTNITVDQLREEFLYPTIENQPGLPTYRIINTIHTLLKTNTASVHSRLGGVEIGFWNYSFTLRHTKKRTTHDFTTPNNPGSSPQFPDGATGP